MSALAEPQAAAVPSRAEVKDLLAKALSRATAEHVEAGLLATSEGSTRFSGNAITQNIAESDCRLWVKAAFGQRAGQADTNDLSDEGIARAVARAEAAAKASAPDLEYLPPVPPQAVVDAEEFDPATAGADPEARAAWIRAAIRAAGNDAPLSGSTATTTMARAVANSRGHFAFHRDTRARFTATAVAPDSTGWAEGQSWRMGDLDPAALARRASEKARLGAHPRTLEPGTYPVILEPAAAAEYLSFLLWSMDAKAAEEGRSCMSGKLGTTVANPTVTLTSDPARPGCQTAPFLADGLPIPRTPWIEKGVLKNLATSRFWAQKSGKAPTGDPANLLVDGGKTPLEEMIRSTERGILVTRFWYIRFVEPMTLLLTGMTRDGLFWIENGKVSHGLKNLRFNESPFRTLQHVEALGTPERCGEYHTSLVPPMKISRFTFSSGTTF